EDFATGRLTLTDCFHELAVRSFPSAGLTCWVAAFLSDGFGDLSARVEVVHPDGERTIYDATHGITIRDRLEVYPYRHHVSGCVFPDPGRYDVLLVVANELVATTTLTVRLKEPDDE
ncbi:MAG: hypothetical protein K2X82_31955, partial [Gemmataceae bacterium]|nr:hypothetical protein [Gemmataceae bacterium]